MQTSLAASIATTFQTYPAWLKITARVAFLLAFIKSAIWLATYWLTLRGFDGL